LQALPPLTVLPKGGSDPESCQVSQQPAIFKVIQPRAPLAARLLVQSARERGEKWNRFQENEAAITHLPPDPKALGDNLHPCACS